jgi:hypothetical protein
MHPERPSVSHRVIRSKEAVMGERNLLVDLYSMDVGRKPNWQAVVDAADFVGGIIKATE